MKIVCIADTHSDYKNLKVPDGDILIHAGDIDAYKFSSALRDFNKWLGSLSHKHKIVIAGNHDGYLDNVTVIEIKEILTNAIYLENSKCKIEGINFWGSPITPTFGEWFFMAERGKNINEHWKKIPKNTDILITHGPPYGILDVAPFPKPTSVGCSDLLGKVKEIKPKYHIFGHIHDAYGIYEQNDITFINASVMNEDYDIVNKPIVIDTVYDGKVWK